MTGFLRFIRIASLAVIALAACAAAAKLASVYWPPPKPLCDGCNVILISIDTLGAKHSSVYDPALDTTPFMKELADTRAVVFEHAYAQAPWTLPSYASLFTGEYPWDIGISGPLDALAPEATTIAEALRSSGYETAGFSNGAYVQPIFGLTQGIDHFAGSFALSDWNDLPGLFQDGSAWLGARKDTGTPFFLLLRPFHAHEPYGDPGTDGFVNTHDIVAANLVPGGPSPEASARFEAAYHTEVRTADEALRAFFAALDASPYANDTVVIITSGNGEEFGEHGTAGAHDIGVHSEHLQVPLMVVLPGQAPERIGETVEIRSIPVTILDLVGASGAYRFAGTSLVPFITGAKRENQLVRSRTSTTRAGFLANTEASNASASEWGVTLFPLAHEGTPDEPYMASAIYGRWHVIRARDGSTQVYDMSMDPEERKDVSGRMAEYPAAEQAVVHRLIASFLTPQ